MPYKCNTCNKNHKTGNICKKSIIYGGYSEGFKNGVLATDSYFRSFVIPNIIKKLKKG